MYKDAPLNHEAIQIYVAPTAVESLERHGKALAFQVKLVVLRVLQRLQRLLEFRGDAFILPQNHLYNVF